MVHDSFMIGKYTLNVAFRNFSEELWEFKLYAKVNLLQNNNWKLTGFYENQTIPKNCS